MSQRSVPSNFKKHACYWAHLCLQSKCICAWGPGVWISAEHPGWRFQCPLTAYEADLIMDKTFAWQYIGFSKTDISPTKIMSCNHATFRKKVQLNFTHLAGMLLFRHCVQLFATPWTAARQASLSFAIFTLSNSCPLCQRCHPTISSSVAPFSSCTQ